MKMSAELLGESDRRFERLEGPRRAVVGMENPLEHA